MKEIRIGLIGAGFMGNLVQKLAALQGPRRLIVADTRADALERAVAGSVFNVVDDEPVGFGDMASTLAKALGLPGPKSIPVGLVKSVSSYVAAMATTNLRVSNARIKRELGWKPRFATVEEGARGIAALRTSASV